jgi:ABC-type glycerol-3-phosphate transport system substrate-binding protein
MTLFSSYTGYWKTLAVLAIGVGLLAALGCQTNNPAVETEPGSSAGEATATVRRNPTPIASSSPSPTATEVSDTRPITLTFWTVEPVSPLAEGELGEFFQTSLDAFERNNPEGEVDLLVKKGSGKGGVVDFLRTAREVAPSVLPDVVVMDSTALSQAYTDGLIQRLDGRLDRSIVQDLLPAARRMGTVNETLAGVPLGIDMEHTVYNTLTYTSTMVLWTDVLSQSNSYVFPANGVNGLVNDITLSQYFTSGGELLGDEGLPKIDDRVLQAVLEFYGQAREIGIMPDTILEAATTEELWPTYLEGRARVAQISVSQYLTDRELLNNTAVGPLPVQEAGNTPAGVMHGWMLVLITDDVERQAEALRLIEFFLATTQNADWNKINKSIPVRDTSFQQLAGDDPYWKFLTEQLNTARPEPRFPGYDRVGRIIQQAVEQVLRGEATPAEATITAIDALAQ